MHYSRRKFIKQTALTLGVVSGFSIGARSEGTTTLRLSACDWSLGAPGPEGLQIAQAVGLQGLEVSVGDDSSEVLAIADTTYRAEYKKQAETTGVAVSSLAMGLLNNAPFATDPRAPGWLEQSIEAAHDLGVTVILLAFFYSGDLLDGNELNPAAVDATVERLKEALPKAEKYGITLGLENWCSAKQNLAILDKIQSDSVKVYYDVGNSTHRGYDVPTEIKELGDRICQVHFKNGADFLGEGQLDTQGVRDSLLEIDYTGWMVLETSVPSGDRDADFKRNAQYLRELFTG